MVARIMKKGEPVSGFAKYTMTLLPPPVGRYLPIPMPPPFRDRDTGYGRPPPYHGHTSSSP